jgi:O-antigen/teichoic acid export membrane protein
MSNLNSRVITATKWSSITEIAAKLVAPLTTMVLARLLTPDAFGVLVTATMVISFAEIFTDAGFQKYLIQHQFKSDDDLYKSTTVAFWSNLVLSLVIWLVIICFSQEIAKLVGNEGRGDVIAISCACIPLAAFSSIQMALYKRKLDFKTLFIVRIIGVFVPIVITIPLAIVTRSYWSLIIGMIAQNFSNALILTIKSTWKPNFFYSFVLLKEMFSFTVWSMVEAISIWLTGYVDIFIVGTMLNQHYLGLYRTSMSTVGQIMGLITAATTPVLFSSLSKLQDNEEEFKSMFFSFQKIVGMLVIPLGVGIYLFSDLVTKILLGNQWMEASHFIGLWALTSSVTIVLANYASEIYRAKGKPKISVLAQVLHLMFLIPTVLWAITKGFNFLCEMRALVRLTSILINGILLYYLVRISFGKMLKNIFPSLISSIIMGLAVLLLIKLFGRNIMLEIIYILVAVLIYSLFIAIFPEERKIMVKAKENIMTLNKKNDI